MEENNKKKSFFKSKLFLFAILPVFALSLVFAAGYVVNNFSAQVDVAEPFAVSYAVLGDAGVPAWQVASCDLVPSEAYVDLSQEAQPIDFDYIYAGENRKLCVKMNNSAEVPLGYIISGEVQTGLGNYDDCVSAFGELTDVTGNVGAFSSVVAEKDIHISEESPVVENCIIDVSVARTSTFE